jgi:carbamoyl-phosphate synthase large subunit
MGVDAQTGTALAKALVASGAALPRTGTVFISVANRDKRAILFPAQRMSDMGFRILATKGTAAVLSRAGVRVEVVPKVSEGDTSVAERIRAGKIDLIVNTPFGRGPRSDGSFIRTAAAAAGIPCITTIPGALAALRGIEALRGPDPEPRSLQEYHAAIPRLPTQERLAAVLGSGRSPEETSAGRTQPKERPA